jgi:hypothetical protein
LPRPRRRTTDEEKRILQTTKQKEEDLFSSINVIETAEKEEVGPPSLLAVIKEEGG